MSSVLVGRGVRQAEGSVAATASDGVPGVEASVRVATRGSRRSTWQVVAVLVVTLGSVSGAAPAEQSVGITVDRVTVVDLRAARGRGKTTLRAHDAGITGVESGDPETTTVRILLDYAGGSAGGAFLVPSGSAAGWRLSRAPGVMYSNSAAPQGPTQMRRLVVQESLLRATASGVGDVPLDLIGVGAPAAGLYVTVELTEGVATTRLCALMTSCEQVPLAHGTGAKLTCRGGTPDPACHGARPIFRRLTDVQYGGPGTVAIIGDSITVQAEDALNAALAAGGWYTFVGAQAGAMFRERQEVAAYAARGNPDVAIIHLGTNDLGCYLTNVFSPDTPCRYPDFGPADEVADAQTMVATFAAARCVLGTTVWFGNIDPLWYEMVASGELSGVVPWREYLETLTSEERSLILADGLGHLTAAGQTQLAQLTAQVVNEVCGPAPAAAE